MGISAHWADYKNTQLFTNVKIKQTNLRCNINNLQVIKPMVIGDPWCPCGQHLPTQLQTLTN